MSPIIAFTAISFAGTEPVKPFGFDDVKVACQNPARFQNQVAPTNIQISCRDLQLKWVVSEESAFTLPTAHAVETSVMSDKYSMAPVVATLESEDQILACAQYKQVSEVVELVRPSSCEELIAFTGTAAEYCRAAVETLRASNPAAIVATDTGRTVSLCPKTTAAKN